MLWIDGARVVSFEVPSGRWVRYLLGYLLGIFTSCMAGRLETATGLGRHAAPGPAMF